MICLGDNPGGVWGGISLGTLNVKVVLGDGQGNPHGGLDGGGTLGVTRVGAGVTKATEALKLGWQKNSGGRRHGNMEGNRCCLRGNMCVWATCVRGQCVLGGNVC